MSDLLISADDGIELLRLREGGQVLSVFIQHVISFFGVIVGDPLISADILDCFFQRSSVETAFFENFFAPLPSAIASSVVIE